MATADVAIGSRPAEPGVRCGEPGCHADAIRWIAARGRTREAPRCGKHAAVIIHRFNVYDPAINPTGSKPCP